MDKIIRFLDELNDEELYEFEKDVKSGTINKFIEQKKEYFKVKDKLCSSCGNNVSEDCIVLIYGDPRIGLRRKAHFCGTDCLEYFMNRHIKKGNKDDQKKSDKIINSI
jgi:UDP-N-acetylmuramyl pentapeptide synthase